MAVNRHYSAKPAVETKADKPSVETKADKSQEGPAKLKSTTTQDKAAKPTNGKRPQEAPLTPYERKERNRKAAAQRRQNRKEQGLCRDCPNMVTLGQTRCEACAENHRVSRRKNNAARREKKAALVLCQSRIVT